MCALTFKQGIHPPYNKELSRDKPLKECPGPEKVIIPLQQHIGAPCEPLVEKGDHVKLGQKIGDSDSFVSAPIHASVAGTVEEIGMVETQTGSRARAITIRADEENSPDESIKPAGELENLEPAEIREKIREAGIVGMGGAMFPTHVKLSVPDDKEIEYYILNGAECEPYLTVDHRMMIEYPDKILFGMKAMMKAAEVDRGLICIEDNKPDAIDSMQNIVKDESNIEVKEFATKYPQGGEKMLIKAALDREVPVGGLPLDVGVIVNNVSTAAAVADTLKKGLPLIKRPVTISGSGIEEPCNLICPIGVSIEELINRAGGFKGNPGKVIMGGPMTGCAQHDISTPISKGTSGVLVQQEGEVIDFAPESCIKCARCVDSCPQYLMPLQLSNYAEHGMLDELEEYEVVNCIECGCCSYVCPSGRPLLHNIKLGKAEVIARRRESNE